MFVAIEHKLDIKPVVPPSKWAWNNLWTNHINVLQHSVVSVAYMQEKMVKRDKNGDKNTSGDIWQESPQLCSHRGQS